MSNFFIYSLKGSKMKLENPLTLENPTDFIKKLIISQSEYEGSENIYSIQCYIDDSIESVSEENIQKTTRIVEDFVTKLSFDKGFIFDDFSIRSSMIGGMKKAYGGSVATIFVSAEGAGRGSGIQIDPNIINQNDFKRIFKSKHSNIHVKMYLEIQKIEEPVLKYVFLYSLISMVVSPYQNIIDEFIEKYIESTVKKISHNNPKSKRENETVYTYIRNRINHTGEQETIECIYNEAKRLCDQFDKVVKKAILIRAPK